MIQRDGVQDNEEEWWCISVTTKGRPIHCPIPPDLSTEQRRWIADRLPRSAKVTRPGERGGEKLGEGPGPAVDSQIDALRTTASQVTEKKLELLELQNKVDVLKLERQKLELEVQTIRGHTKSFASVFGELVSAVESKFKK